MKFHEAVILELENAVEWYHQRGEGLGISLCQKFDNTFELIKKSPDGFPLLETIDWNEEREIRRVHLSRFPYMIVYEMILKEPVVIAVAHTSQKVNYWRDRKTDSI